jgi:hypothetical protein
MITKVYVLAQNSKEAWDLFDCGFGYASRDDALRALKTDKDIDDYYRKLLKVFEFDPARRRHISDKREGDGKYQLSNRKAKPNSD